MEKSSRRSSGPRTFDRNQAVATAMRLFRIHGYKGVSVADLCGAIGIAPPSLYAAFGSKAGIYREALDLYAGLPGALDGMEGAGSLEAAVGGLLEAAIDAVTSEERGCMISTGLVEGAVEQQQLVRELADRRRALRDRIADALCTWLATDEARRLATYLSAVQQGISVQARDGATATELRGIAEDVVAGIAARRGASASQRSSPSNE
ncbi:TetR/AcrR family transcriptional regulator [Sphingomonas melonis]|uniref:AcrR family transcriptional regulator n=1 Tax=Sphingomonas melonis TaxID=152682 RepID=A0A7Y9FKV7_9SPHN|nr:TetR/AcrR family transcriptional regulator [Sphingomonas melonis]NYD89185.1 AcrR family transcriptional regulator [Sphingomonas melonis]